MKKLVELLVWDWTRAPISGTLMILLMSFSWGRFAEGDLHGGLLCLVLLNQLAAARKEFK